MTQKTKSQGKQKAERDAVRQREIAATSREVGDIPPIANVRRRARCRNSLRFFCETYNPSAFAMRWSEDHLRVIARIEEAATLGALYAFAMPRGSGKSTLCRMAALWAVAYCHRRYVFVIGANSSKASDTLLAVRTFARFLDTFAADFPEIAAPVRHLAGIANRASGQTCGGLSTSIEWSADRIVLPTVATPANWPKSWPLRSDGMAPTSGGVVSASGLTGDGIRGSLFTLTTGESIRPDLVLLDDPQSSESAHSRSQNVTREQLVSADVLGMAGPGKTISAVMPCTVIARGDFVDSILDREKHPLWRGERTRMLRTMPTDLTAWDTYFEIYHRCAQMEPPSFAEANAHYVAHRERLEDGAVASWSDRKLPGEVSAIQHAMNLYVRDRRAFMAEYQNDPEDGEIATDELTSDEITDKLTRVPRGAVPAECSRLTAFIDVGGKILFYTVVGWDEKFGGAVIDYGTFPRQGRSYFAATDARPTLADLFPGMDEGAAIYSGLKALAGEVLGKSYPRHGVAGELQIERCLIDAGWGKHTDTVHQFCRQSPFSNVLLPSKGYAVGASGRPMAEWTTRPGERTGWNWRVTPVTGGGRLRLCVFDPNIWKSFAHDRLRTPFGSAGSLGLFGSERTAHQLFADHVTAEYRVETQGRGRRVQEWKVRPDRVDNHWLDCLTGACVAASVGGLAWSASVAAGEKTTARDPVKREKWSEIQARKLAASGGR